MSSVKCSFWPALFGRGKRLDVLSDRGTFKSLAENKLDGTAWTRWIILTFRRSSFDIGWQKSTNALGLLATMVRRTSVICKFGF